MPQMNSKTKSIGEIFTGTNKFEVPRHQRDYSWTETEVSELFVDITSSLEKSANSCYIGMIVLVVPNPDLQRFQILDGQQRLTTISILIAALRDWCKAQGKHDEAQRMQSEFIGFADYGQTEHDPRITLNLNNREYFDKEIVNGSCTNDPDDSQKTNRLNYSAFNQLNELLKQFLSGVRSKPKRIEKAFALLKYIRDNLQATVLDVNEPEDAYTIFESLNDRGLALSIFDLLKNHIYRELGSSREALATAQWINLTSNLREKKPDEFIRAFWILRNGRIQKGTLFSRIKSLYSGPANARKLITEMVNDSEAFSGIDVADSDVWYGYSDEIRENVRSIVILGAQQTRLILLAAILKGWKENELKRLTKGIISLIVRHQTVGRERSGSLEVFCAEISHGIFTKSNSISDVLNRIREFYPDDSKFTSDFSSYQETRAQRAKYFLSEIETFIWKTKNPNSAKEHEVSKDIDKVNIEHILPKQYSTDPTWHSLTKDDKEIGLFVSYLGNQCLLAKGPNGKIGNKPFAQKRDAYRKSAIESTKLIAAHSSWNRSDIIKRQMALADIAVKIWSI